MATRDHTDEGAEITPRPRTLTGLTLTSEATIAAKAPGFRFLPLADELLPFSAVWASRNENPALLLLLESARQLSLDAAYHPTAEPET